MNTKKALPDLKLKILCVLADNKGHTAQDIEEILDAKNKKLIDEKNLRRPSTLLYDKKTGHVIGFESTSKRRAQQSYKSIYKSNLSPELQELLSLDWIYREPRIKERSPGERGHKEEFVYYIKEETYSIIDRILTHEVKKERHQLKGAVQSIDDWPTHYNKQLGRFYQWNYSKNPEMFDKYIQAALYSAKYKKVDMGRPYRGYIPAIPEIPEIGGINEENCKDELRSYLEKWIALELSLGLQLPPIDGHLIEITPCQEPQLKKVEEKDLPKIMEEAMQENIRLTNEGIKKN